MNFLSLTAGRYRMFGYPYQYRVYSHWDIMEAVGEHNGAHDCFISISEYEDEDDVRITHPLFFLCDFDADEDNQPKVNRDVAAVLEWAEERGIGFVLDESGAKGMHIIFELARNNCYNTKDYQHFHEYLKTQLDLQTIDPHCCETRHLCRIPGTLHPKTGRECVTVLTQEGATLDLYEYVGQQTHSNEVTAIEYDRGTSDTRFVFPFPYYAPCIYEKVKNDDVDHVVRWYWVKLLEHQGLTFDEIYEECKNAGWSDFDPYLTAYQIKKTLAYGATLKCRKDICIEECPFRKKENIVL